MASGMVGSTTGPWTLAVDFGTSFTVAAVRSSQRSPEVIEIGGDRRVPSVVFVDDDATLRVGRAAEDLAASRPGRAVRAPKRRLGEPAPVVLGGKPYQVVDLVAALLRYVYDEAVRHQGSAPSSIRLTHPASWSRPRMARLLEAAAKAGLGNVALISEPVAAAVAYAADVDVLDGSHVAVYDLGGGTFDMTLLRFSGGTFSIVGRPGGDVNLGGELFDELLVNMVGERLDPPVWDEMQVSNDQSWQQAAAALRTECRRAKEALSTNSYADLVLPLPGGMTSQRITRDDLETLVQPYIAESVRLLVQGVSDAGVDPHSLAAVYLVGGASRMPLVERSVAEALPGVAVSRRGDPKTAVAVGATLAELSASVLDLQAAPTRTTLESDGGIRPAGLPVTPPSAGSFDRAAVGGSAEPVAVSPLTVPQPGTVIEPPSVVAAAPLSPPSPPPFSPQPPHAAAQPVQPPPAAFPMAAPAKQRTPLIAAGVAVGVLVLGGLGFAVTRGSGDKAATSTSTSAASIAAGGGSGGVGTVSTVGGTLKPVTTIASATSVSASTTTTPKSPPTTVPPSPVTTVKAGPPDRALNNDQADKVLLSVDEVATATGADGWIPDSFSSGPALCGYETPNGTIEKHLVADLKEPNGVLQVTSGALTYASVEDVNANYDALKLATTSCPNNKSVEETGTFTLLVTPGGEPVVPGLDRTLLVGIAAQAPGLPTVQTVLIIGVRGRSAITLQYSYFGRGPDESDTTRATALFAAMVVELLAVT
jgi:molecular chaperone DnaK